MKLHISFLMIILMTIGFFVSHMAHSEYKSQRRKMKRAKQNEHVLKTQILDDEVLVPEAKHESISTKPGSANRI